MRRWSLAVALFRQTSCSLGVRETFLNTEFLHKQQLLKRYTAPTVSSSAVLANSPATFTDENVKARKAEKILDELEEDDSKRSERDFIISRAWNLATAAAEEGSIRGRTLQGFMYNEGMGVPRNREKATIMLKEAAQLGDPYAQFGIGKVMLEDVNKDEEHREQAEDHKAFVVGSDDNGVVRGNVHFVGGGNKEHLWTPAELVRKVRKDRRREGFTDAEAREFEAYKLRKEEESAKQRRAEALEWLRRAADHNVAAANVLIGDAVVHENAALARECYSKAAKDTRDPQVYYRLGQLYFKGGSGVAKDHKAALKNFSMSANLGDANGQFFLGHAYRVGEMGLEVDFPASLQYIEMAAEQKHPAALYYLALMHRDGQGGLTASIPAFRRYLEESAALGHVGALFYMADMHYKGTDGADIDYRIALNYYREAGKGGSADALCSAAAMYFHGIGTPSNYEKAFNLYQEAVMLGSTKAMQCLGSMHYHGHFVPKSKERSQYYFKLVEEQEKKAQQEAEAVRDMERCTEEVTARTRSPRSVDPGCGGGPNDT